MSTRCRTLAAHARALADDDLNDLLVELPHERFAALVEVALTRPCVPDTLALSFHRAAPRQDEATRWDVWVSRRRIGVVARQTPTGDESAGWVAYARPGGQAGEQPVGAGARWPTRA